MHENPQSNTNRHPKWFTQSKPLIERLFTPRIDFLVNARGRNQVAEEITRGWRYNKSTKRERERERERNEREREKAKEIENGKRTKKKRIKNEVDIGTGKTVSPRSRGIFKLPIFRCSRPPWIRIKRMTRNSC